MDDQYQQVCKDEFKQINNKLDYIIDKVFLDNGDCLQSRTNKNSLWIKIIIGVFSTIGAAVISMVVWMARGKL